MMKILRFLKLILLTFVINVICEGIVFELWPPINNIVLDRPLLKGPMIQTSPLNCSRHCIGHPNCSVFGFNLITGSCSLYGDVLVTDGDLGNHMDGQRYFVIRKRWCPLKQGFLVFRSSGLCVWYSNIRAHWTQAQGICESLTGRLVALSSEDKMIAVVEAVNDIGNGNRYHVGGTDSGTEGVWVWSDGTPAAHISWAPGEPNGERRDNYLASCTHGAFCDVTGHAWSEHFVCEIVD